MKEKGNIINLFGDKGLEDFDGVKYSTLLEEFIAPFEHDFPFEWFIEDTIQFAITAWNLGNISHLMPKEELEKAILMTPDVDDEKKLLNKLVEHKRNKYSEYDRFIADFELTEKESGEFILSVVTEFGETFLSKIETEMEGQLTEVDYRENYINRQALIIKPKQPFFDWINRLEPEDKITEADIDESNIYLVDAEIHDIEKWLQKKFKKFFEMELEDWWLDKKDWPQKRSFKMFKQWFHVEISSMIYDLEKRPVLKEG